MPGPVVSRPLLVAVAACGLVLQAQTADLWKEGAWSVELPAAGACGSLPLLQVKGPGSIFDAKNAPALASLERDLPALLTKVCPAVREVILWSGRTRRLTRLPPPPTQSNAPAPQIAAPPRVSSSSLAGPPLAPPIRSDPLAEESRTPLPARPDTPVRDTPVTDTPVSGSSATVISVQPGGSAPPPIARSSNLRSLTSAHSMEGKCEVLLEWLETSKKGRPATAVYPNRQTPEVLAIFRDEPMTAVFGEAYDKTGNRWRLDQYENVISHCTGQARQAPNPITHQVNRSLAQFAQQFQQYRQVLDQAFLGTPGPYEPAAVSRYVQQVRDQISWAQQAMASAASASSARESFERIREQRQAVNTQLSLLGTDEKNTVATYLERRQSEVAAIVTEVWLSRASASPKTLASAKALVREYAGIAPASNALDSPARAAFEERYKQLVDSLLVDPMKAETAKLSSIPATLPGILQMAAWKATFDAGFRELRGFQSVQAAEIKYEQARARVVTGALPSWMKQVDALPVNGAAITAKRHELETFFPTREDRSSPAFVQYEAPLRSKEDQLRASVETQLRKKQDAEAAEPRKQQPAPEQKGSREKDVPRPGASGGSDALLTASSFQTSGLRNESTLANLYRGDFTKIDFDRDDMNFANLFGQYIRAYGQVCDAHLPQTKVKVTYQECDEYWVTRNGYGVETNRSCSHYRTVFAGYYADPAMYAVKNKLDQIQAGDAFRTLGKMMSQKDMLGGAMNMIGTAQAIQSDMDGVVQQNGCTSPGLKRFEENLKLFALNKQPIRLGDQGAKLSAISPLPGIPFRDQDYSRLVDDLISENSRSWAMNRYIKGSVAGASVMSRDSQGRPSKIGARYTYNGMNGRMQGGVTLEFTDGLPECMYFADMPATCRTPNRKIVAAYSDGAYQPK